MPVQSEGERRGYQGNAGLVPIPDPTALTTSQLDREIRHLELRVLSELKTVEKSIAALQELFSAQVNRIQMQFEERDKQTALALQGQKDLGHLIAANINTTVEKMDRNYTKLFDQMQVLLSANTKNFDEKIADVKSSLDKTDARKGRIDIMSVFSALASLAAVITLIFILLTRH